MARWCRVIFSDKSKFELWSGNRFMWIRRARGFTRFESKFTMKTVKYPAKVMVWGCFSIKGPGNLSFLPKSQPYGEPRPPDSCRMELPAARPRPL